MVFILPLLTFQSSTTLEEINGVCDFVEKLHIVDLPNQMVSVLDDPLLQNYILLAGNPNSEARIDQWLALFFDVQLQMVEDSGHTSKSLVEMLEKILNYTRRTKVAMILAVARNQKKLMLSGSTEIYGIISNIVSSSLGWSREPGSRPELAGTVTFNAV